MKIKKSGWFGILGLTSVSYPLWGSWNPNKLLILPKEIVIELSKSFLIILASVVLPEPGVPIINIFIILISLKIFFI